MYLPQTLMSATVRRDYKSAIIIVGILLEASIVPATMAIRLLQTNTPALVSIFIENPKLYLSIPKTQVT